MVFGTPDTLVRLVPDKSVGRTGGVASSPYTNAFPSISFGSGRPISFNTVGPTSRMFRSSRRPGFGAGLITNIP